jgi:hypothetical protein
MRLFRTKVWSWADIWILKWCAFLFGIIGGAYLSDFVKQYVWVLLVLAVALAIKSGIKYFGGND